MATKKITQLPAAGTLLGTDVFPVVNGAATKKATVAALLAVGLAPVAVPALDIDWSAGSSFTKTLAGGGSVLTFSNLVAGKVIVARITGAASTPVTYPAGVKWAGGVAPTQTATGTDVYTFFYDGTDVFGSVLQAFA